MLTFDLIKTEGLARRGRLTLNHGVVQTPISCRLRGITPLTVP